MTISCKVTFIECYNSRSLFDVFLPSLYPDKVVVVVMYSDITAETLPPSQSEEVQGTERNYLWFTKHDKANLSFSRRRSYEIRFHLTSLFDQKMCTHIILEYRNNRLSVEQHFRSQFPDGNLTVARECFCMSDLCEFQVDRKLINLKSIFRLLIGFWSW